jgi:hypothetical protein
MVTITFISFTKLGDYSKWLITKQNCREIFGNSYVPSYSKETTFSDHIATLISIQFPVILPIENCKSEKTKVSHNTQFWHQKLSTI